MSRKTANINLHEYWHKHNRKNIWFQSKLRINELYSQIQTFHKYSYVRADILPKSKMTIVPLQNSDGHKNVLSKKNVVIFIEGL